MFEGEKLYLLRDERQFVHFFVYFCPHLFAIYFELELPAIFQVDQQFTKPLVGGVSNVLLDFIYLPDGEEVKLFFLVRSDIYLVVCQNEERFLVLFFVCFVGEISIFAQYYYFPPEQVILYKRLSIEGRRSFWFFLFWLGIGLFGVLVGFWFGVGGWVFCFGEGDDLGSGDEGTRLKMGC